MNNNNDKRSFTIMYIGKHGGCKTKFRPGRYINKTPAEAAKKAFNEHCRRKRIRGVCTFIVTLRETTLGSKKKLYSYKLNRQKLKNPIIRLEGTPQEFVIEYTSTVKSVDVPVACRKPGQTRGRPLKKRSRKNALKANNVRRKRKFVVRKTAKKGLLSSLF